MNTSTVQEKSTKSTRQIELERESVELGAVRYRKEQPLPWRKDAPGQKEESELKPGKRLLMDAIEPVAAGVQEFLDAANSGKAGRRHAAVAYLQFVEPIEAAYIATRCAINAASQMHSLQKVLLVIGSAIEDHLDLTSFAEKAPGLMRMVSRQLDGKTKNANHRKKVMSHAMLKAEVEKLSWANSDKLKIGQALLEIVMERTGLVETVRMTEAANDTPIYVRPTELCSKFLSDGHSRCALLNPVYLPMVVPPKPWRTPFIGGYLSNAIKGFRLVKTFNRAYLDELASVDMPIVYASVNNVQSVAWRINKPVLEVMRTVWDAGSDIGGLPSRSPLPFPPRPANIPDKDSGVELTEEQQKLLKGWKAKTAKVHEENSRLESQRLGMSQKLWIAERFVDEEELYFPHQLDWRGRIYPAVPFVNPQADDSGKALLQFAVGKPLDENGAYWLAVHIANLFGIDKVSFDDRVAWVMDHEEELLDSAALPLDGKRFWTQADSPYCALAACFEWAGYRVMGDEFVSYIPIAMDGSCSGLQHFSAMLRDPIGGAAVNLVPGARPSDIYTQVAKVAQVKVDAMDSDEAKLWRGGKVIRKLSKQPTMTLCYGATLRGMQGQIEAALRKLDAEGKPYLGGADNYAASRFLGEIIHASIGEVVVAARDAMAWLQVAARVAANEGLPVRWSTPAGMIVQQEYKEQIGKRFKVYFGGKEVKLIVNEEGDKLNKRRQASGISPNFVHSLDSSHLMATVNTLTANGVYSFACIHDSFGTHAADVDVLHKAIRQAFVEQYTPDVLARFREELIAQLPEEKRIEIPELPPKGALELAAVMAAEYSFA